MTWHEQIITNSASLVDKPWITLFMVLVALDVITGTAVFFHITTSSTKTGDNGEVDKRFSPLNHSIVRE